MCGLDRHGRAQKFTFGSRRSARKNMENASKSACYAINIQAGWFTLKAVLLDYLCDPVDKSELSLVDAVCDADGNIMEGALVSQSGRVYPIRNGVPRFIGETPADTVQSFGDEWNHFNFDGFKLNWLGHTVRNTFGSSDVFRGKVVVDAGAGSGMQSRWMAESGAKYVISLELSHSVDGVMQSNLDGLENVDVIQCSIDTPPIRDNSIEGIVICHNVIQHTPSVEKTASALWRLVGNGSELVFNCYGKQQDNPIWMLRFRLYSGLRNILSRASFKTLLNYSRLMSVLRFVPIFGVFLEKSLFMVRGNVPAGPHYLKRCYVAGTLNTFDWYGSHSYQHHKTEHELRNLISELQPDEHKVLNLDKYFTRPLPPGLAIRIQK